MKQQRYILSRILS